MKAEFSKNMITISYKMQESVTFFEVHDNLIADSYSTAMTWFDGDVISTTFTTVLTTIEEMKQDYRIAKGLK